MKPGMRKGMGGVGGDGVRDWHRDDHDSRQVTSLREFEDFYFAVEKWPPSPAWAAFLRSFLLSAGEELVFTHGDLSPANVMIVPDPENGVMMKSIRHHRLGKERILSRLFREPSDIAYFCEECGE